MKTKEIFDLTSAEIEQKINSYKEELFNLRFQAVTGHLENTARIGQVRKNIARCKTILYGGELDTNRSKKRRKRG